MGSDSLDIRNLTGINTNNPEEFKAILSRLSYFGAQGTQEFVSELIEHVILHSMSRMPPGLHSGLDIYQAIKKHTVKMPFELEPILATLRRMDTKGVKCTNLDSDLVETELKYYLEPKIKSELLRSYNVQINFEERVIQNWMADVNKRHPDLTSSDIDIIRHDLEAFSYRLCSQHSVESVSFLLPENQNIKKLLSQMDDADLNEILPSRSKKLEGIRRFELPRFFLDADDDRKMFISQKLNSTFMLHMLQLDKKDAETLKDMISGGTVFLDTNVLYRLFGLDGIELRNATIRLKELSTKLGYRMVVSPRTIEEYRWSIQYHIQQAKSLPKISPELARLALEVSYGDDVYSEYFRYSTDTYGMSYEGALKFFTKIEPLLEENDIEIEKEGDLFIRSSYKELENEESYLRDYAPGKYSKNDHVINHDAFLRLLILHHRQGQEEESYLETRYWLLTLDTGLFQYDRRIRSRNKLKIPYCVLSSQWMQLLQPFSAVLKDSQAAFQIAQASSLDSPLFRLFKLPSRETIADIITRLKMIDGLPPKSIVYAVADSAFVQAFSDTRDDAKREEIIQQMVHDQILVKMEVERKKLEEELQKIKDENLKVASQLEEKIQKIEEYQNKEDIATKTQNILKEELVELKKSQDSLQHKLQSILSQKSNISEQREELSKLVKDLDKKRKEQEADLERLQESYKSISQERAVIVEKYKSMVADVQAKQISHAKVNAIFFVALAVVALEIALWSWQLPKPFSWMRLSILLLGLLAIEGIVLYKRKISIWLTAVLSSISIFTLIVIILLPLGVNLSDIYIYVATAIQAIASALSLAVYLRRRSDNSNFNDDIQIHSSGDADLQGNTRDTAFNKNISESQRWIEMGDEAQANGEYEIAQQAYQKAGELGKAKLERVTIIKQQVDIEHLLQIIKTAKQKNEWAEVIKAYRNILKLKPENEVWIKELEIAKVELFLANKYNNGINNMHAGNYIMASQIFKRIVEKHPNYRDSKYQLERAIKLREKESKQNWRDFFTSYWARITAVGLVLLITILSLYGLGSWQEYAKFNPTPLNGYQVTAIAATRLALTALPQDRIIFQDDFSSNSHEWYLGKFDWSSVSGFTKIENGFFRIDASSQAPVFARSQIPNLFLKNFRLAIDVRLIKQNNTAGVGFQFRSHENGYYEARFGSNGYCDVFYFNGSEFITLGNCSTDQIRLSPGVENHLSIEVIDSTITLYANGEKILTVDDETYLESGNLFLGADLWLKNTRVVLDFDNLLITSHP